VAIRPSTDGTNRHIARKIKSLLAASMKHCYSLRAMNLHALTIHMMINITETWFSDPELVQTIEKAGPLGIGVIAQLEKAHGPLAELENKRAAAEASLRDMIEHASDLDAVHDRKARSVYFHLQGLIEGTDDPGLAAGYRAFEALLFPTGLRVVQLPYIEEGGAAVALERAVGVETRAKLAKIGVGEQNLLQLFEAWMKAGHALGEAVTDRAELKASLMRARSAAGELDVKAGRGLWIQAVRGLLWVLEVDASLAGVGERILAALEEASTTALRRRVGVEGANVEGEPLGLDDVASEPPGDIEPVAHAPSTTSS
jgi:hypothetical protein